MSEYQYYEFRAVDRPLKDREMAELRALSTRATITPTSFQNEYNWGDFRGNPLELMKRYFDAFVYVTNWGTRTLMLRLPASLLPRETADRYAIEPGVKVHASGDNVILELTVEEEEPEWAEGEGWLGSLLPLRDDISRGDVRALYIGWLSALWMDDYEDEDEEDEDLREPPVPPGLQQLTVPLRKLAEFLQVDSDLLEVAAQRSGAAQIQPETVEEWKSWVRRVPDSEKDRLLLQVMQGEGMEARASLLRRYRQDSARVKGPADGGGRTMAGLIAMAEAHRAARKQREEEQAARERERRAREEAAARERYLADLAGREEEIWLRIDALLQVRRGPEYEQATRYVVDLRDVAQREGREPAFAARLTQLRERHASKPAFIRRLDAAKLG